MRRLTAKRMAAGMTKAALARRCDMSASTIGQIESGYIGRPYPGQLARLAEALSVPLSEAESLLDYIEVGDGDH